MNFESKFLHVADKLPQHHSSSFKNLGIVIEWPKGSVRTGKDKNGKKWSRKMEADYGYIPDTAAAGDKEGLDVYIGPNEQSEKVFVVEQLTDDGEFDEYKCLLGFDDLDTAFETYLKHYPDDWEDNNVAEVYEVPFHHLFDAVEEHQEKTAAAVVNDYLWLYDHKNRELYITPGKGSRHYQTFVAEDTVGGDGPCPPDKICYRDYLLSSTRGYAYVDPSKKTVELGLSISGDDSLHYFPEMAIDKIQKKFPGYSIEERGSGDDWRSPKPSPYRLRRPPANSVFAAKTVVSFYLNALRSMPSS